MDIFLVNLGWPVPHEVSSFTLLWQRTSGISGMGFFGGSYGPDVFLSPNHENH